MTQSTAQQQEQEVIQQQQQQKAYFIYRSPRSDDVEVYEVSYDSEEELEEVWEELDDSPYIASLWQLTPTEFELLKLALEKPTIYEREKVIL